MNKIIFDLFINFMPFLLFVKPNDVKIKFIDNKYLSFGIKEKIFKTDTNYVIRNNSVQEFENFEPFVVFIPTVIEEYVKSDRI
jgi:hypothetical protein